MATRQPKCNRSKTVVPFPKSPVCHPERPEMDAPWQTLLTAVADIHAIIIQGVLSGAFQEDQAGPVPTLNRKEALKPW
jgi:hypothetical protein